MFSREICGIFKNNYCEEHMRTAASKHAQLFALRQRNHTLFELSCEAVNATQDVSSRIRLFMVCKERHNL